MSKTHLCSGENCTAEIAFESKLCDPCLENAAIKNLANFGEPDHFLCGYCGTKFSKEEFVAHLNSCTWDIGCLI